MGYLSKRGSQAARVCLASAVAATITVVGIGQAPPSYAAPGTVSGSVFQDFDGDGTRDAGNLATGEQTDIGFAPMTVTAYGPHNEVVGTDDTVADGSYTIDTTSVPDGTPLRIEFTDANGGTTPQLPGDYQSSFHGAGNGTSVQFAAAGDDNVDFGVLEPEDFADNNAPIVTAIQYAGLRTDPAGTDLPAVVANPWVVPPNDPPPGQDTTFPGRVDLASYGAVGSVWGTAFNRSQNAAYAAATYKRVSDMGPLGLGGIYRIPNVVNQTTGALNPTPGGVVPWLDVKGDLGVDVGDILPSTGTGSRLLGAPNALVRDPDAYTKAGKVGIGGIAVSEDGSTLFFVNLFDKTLYAVNLPADGSTPTSATPISLDLGADQRPWAVAVHRDRVYVGYVDTGGDGATPGLAATGSFYVVSQPVAGGTWRSDLTAPLSYTKGNAINTWGPTIAAGDGLGATPLGSPPAQVLRWNSWTDEWYWGTNESVGFNTGYGWTHVYPQAILGSLAFDAEGFLVLGFVDRTAIQAGNRQWGSERPVGCPPLPAACNDRRFFETVSSGDTLVAAPAGGGSFTLESNGSVGGRTAMGTTPNQGPGGREFINDRQNLGNGTNHYENTLGGIATYPGVPQVASTAMDPLGAIRLAGLEWFSLTNGAAQRGYNHTDDPLTGAPTHADGPKEPTAAYFQKGGGLGAVSILTREAPVEIGNRVWLDADFNGRQDPDEPNISGAPVQLFVRGPGGAPTEPALDETSTDDAGEYYFRSDEIDGFDPASAEGETNPYVVEFGKGTGPVTVTGPNADHPGFAGITWADLDFTTRTSAASAGLQRDSNPVPDTGRAPVDVGPPGHNDHTIDAGFHTTGAFQIQKLTEGGSPAPGQTFTFDVTAATNFRGDDVLDTVNPKTFQIRSGEIRPAVPQQLPVGTEITIQERGGDPSYEPGDTQVITVNDGEPLLFTAINQVPPPSTPKIRTVASADRVKPGKPFRDRIHVSGLAAGHVATAVARLYGPFESRADAACNTAHQVRSQTLHVTNGRNLTDKVRVNAPGLYTWKVSIKADHATVPATHPCGQVAETVVVAKPPYVAPEIVGGFSGTIDSSADSYRRAPTTTIRMPGIGMRAAVLPERVVDGKMTLPGNVRDVGWLRKSAGINDKIGTAVIGGHVSDRHDRPGAMFNLKRARAGQRITVTRGGTPYRFEVVSKATFDRRDKLPHRYFATTGRHRLALISCTSRVVFSNGHFHYTRYIVVLAKQVHR